jgi:hypothetical protein
MFRGRRPVRSIDMVRLRRGVTIGPGARSILVPALVPALVLALVLLTVLGVGGPGIAHAGSLRSAGGANEESLGQSGGPEVDTTITTNAIAGVGGYGHPNVVLVEITARRPLRGTVQAGTDFGGGSVDVKVELPTGGKTRVWLPVPSNYLGGNVVLKETGKDDRPITTPGFSIDNGMNVGVLPSLAGAVPSFAKATTVRGQTPAQLVRLSLDDLESNSWVLDSFDVLAASSADLAPLSIRAREHVIGWVRSGGELLLDDDVAIDGVPKTVTKTLVSRGTIRRTGGELRAGNNWATVLLPNSRWGQNSQDINEWLAQSSSAPGYFDQPVAGLLARRSIKLPPGKMLILVLFGYGLVCAPMVFALLRKKRPMAIWLVGPLLATAVTGFVTVVGGVNRQNSKDLQVVVFDVGAGEPTAVVEQARTKSTTIKLPTNWYPIGNSQLVEGGSMQATTLHAGRNPEFQVGVISGGVQTVRVRGPVDAATVPGSLVVTASMTGNTVSGTIRNTGSTTIRAVRLLSASMDTSVGEIKPGATATYNMVLGVTSLPSTPEPGKEIDPEAALKLVEGAWRSGANGPTIGIVSALAVVDAGDAGDAAMPLDGPTTAVVGISTSAPISGLSRVSPVFVPNAEEVLRVDYNGDAPEFQGIFTPGSVWADSDWKSWAGSSSELPGIGRVPEASRTSNVLVMRKG